MSEAVTTEIAVGDQVRVHFHPPNPMKSLCEGVVRRADVAAPEGRFFVVEVTHEIILDQEHRVRPSFQDYVRYECRNDFPGRIEVFSATQPDIERETAPLLTTAETPEAVVQDAQEKQAVQPDACGKSEVEPTVETDAEPFQVHLERQPVRRQGGLVAALFGRKK
jgi:hypothetical protein